MSDLIKREDAVEAVYEALRTPLPDYRNDFFHDSMSYAIKIVNNIPSVEPERKTGKWKSLGYFACQCTECGTEFYELEYTNFCSYCGANMKGDDEYSG